MCRWASVTMRISSHSDPVGSGRFWRVFTISSFLRRSLFSSIRRRLATRFESSSTTGRRGGEGGGGGKSPRERVPGKRKKRCAISLHVFKVAASMYVSTTTTLLLHHYFFLTLAQHNGFKIQYEMCNFKFINNTSEGALMYILYVLHFLSLFLFVGSFVCV